MLASKRVASARPDVCPDGRSTWLGSPVTIIRLFSPKRVRNIFICIDVVFCASSRITAALLNVRPRMKAKGAISMRFASRVTEIHPRHIIVETEHGRESIANDFVLALTGFHPDRGFLTSAGVTMEAEGYPTFDEETMEMARGYCAPLREAGVNTLILGCTHYPRVAPMLQRILGRNVRLVSGGHAVAAAIQRTLERCGLAREGDEEGTYEFFCTGPVSSFGEVATRFLQMPLGEVRQVEFSVPA